MITTAETGAPAKLTRNEGLKAASPTLAGNISATLADAAVDREFRRFRIIRLAGAAGADGAMKVFAF